MATKRDFVVKNGLVVTEDIELGHASDTTIARASAGQITVEGTAVVLAGSASHDGFSDFVANEHIDHSGVSITAGNGLTGGGTIASTRTLTVGAGTGVTVNANDVAIGQAVGTSDDVTFATVTLASDLIHSGDTNNKIAFGTDTQSFQTGGTARFNISDSGLQIGSGARVTTINTSFSDNDTSLMTSAAINDRIESFGYITSQMTFVLEDDDGTEVSISNAEEIKFHSGDTSVDINYSDISPGSDADPFDLDFRTLHAPYLRTSDDRDFAPEDLDNTIRELSGRFSTKTGIEDGSSTGASDYVDALVLDTFTGHSGGDANLLAFAKNSTKRIYHYRADQDDTNWGTASTIAYTSDIADLTVSDLAAAAVVTESEGIGSNDNDTTLPTSAAVKDYVDSNAGGASAIGDLSDAITTATSNIGLGSGALDSLASGGNFNTALGINAGTTVSTGTMNVMVGLNAGQYISSGGSNIAIGKGAIERGSTENNNLAIGPQAMGGAYGQSATGAYNVAIGSDTMRYGSQANGSGNIGIGYKAIYGSNGNSSGANYNIGIGYGALEVITTGDKNIIIGYDAGDNITTGSNNLVIGDFQVDTATGDDQIIIGSGDGGVTWLKGDANGIKALKIKVKAVSSNTTLTDAQSGSYVYWTAGTLTLPATAESGQQYTIINNTGGSATPSLGTSNAIASGWTSHAAMSDETARTYVAVATNTWIYIG